MQQIDSLAQQRQILCRSAIYFRPVHAEDFHRIATCTADYNPSVLNRNAQPGIVRLNISNP